MRNSITIIAIMLCCLAGAQEHFAGVATSKNTGFISGIINPSEFANLNNSYTLNTLSVSAYMSNNKIGFSDLVASKNFESEIFSGNTPASFSADFEILGPSLAYKHNKCAFAITTTGKTKANIIDLNNDLGNAIVNGKTPESLEVASTVLANYNQKVTGTSWGELGLSAAGELYNYNGHKIDAGVTLKILFPGSYIRMNASDFSGTITYHNNAVSLTDAYSNVNFAYSGNIANDYGRESNFANYFGKGPNGLSADIGVNYSWDDNDDGEYRFKAGVAVRNLGSMTFKDANNQSNSYVINVPDGQYLNLEQFKNDYNIKDVEQKLIQSGFAQIVHQNTNFKVNMPANLTLYADVNIIPHFYLSAYTQQKLKQQYELSQIAVQNITTVIPRYTSGKFEAFVPLSSSEMAGFAAGIGLRYGGFYIGSGSLITAALNNSNTHQADGYLGFSIAF